MEDPKVETTSLKEILNFFMPNRSSNSSERSSTMKKNKIRTINWENILTETQKKLLIENTMKVLRKILTLPLTGLIKDIEIADYRDGGSSYYYGTLYLTKRGLEEVTGYHEGWSDPFSPYTSDYEPPRRQKIKNSDFRKFIEKYKLTPEKINQIYTNLLAK